MNTDSSAGLKLMAQIKTAAAVIALLLLAGTAADTMAQTNNTDDSWDTGNLNTDVLKKLPGIVKIIPSRFPHGGSWAGSGERCIGIGEDLRRLVYIAYGQKMSRTIFLTEVPTNQFDFIANLPEGSASALQSEIAKQFKVTIKRERIETNVWFLRVTRPNAPGLRPTTNSIGSSSSSHSPGRISSRNQPITSIGDIIESSMAAPIIDQTGLKGRYDIDLNWQLNWHRNDLDQNNLKQALSEQLGLELVPGTAPVEFLVVEKAK